MLSYLTIEIYPFSAKIFGIWLFIRAFRRHPIQRRSMIHFTKRSSRKRAESIDSIHTATIYQQVIIIPAIFSFWIISRIVLFCNFSRGLRHWTVERPPLEFTFKYWRCSKFDKSSTPQRKSAKAPPQRKWAKTKKLRVSI